MTNISKLLVFIYIIGDNKHDNADEWCYYSWLKDVDCYLFAKNR